MTEIKRGSLSDPEGLWLVDKPVGPSSFKSVAMLRRLTNIKKIGHAGTLDPLASGLMLLLVGKTYTRKADIFLKLDKTYALTLRLGQTSTTDDAEGEVTDISPLVPTSKQVTVAINQLTGEIDQKPPIFSAIKTGGQRAYKLARQGNIPELAARKITVYAWKNLRYTYPYIYAEVDVASGTYIRSLARDLGTLLETGAHLTELRRTKISEYSVSDAVDLEKLFKI